jgi:hypothetical protein
LSCRLDDGPDQSQASSTQHANPSTETICDDRGYESADESSNENNCSNESDPRGIWFTHIYSENQCLDKKQGQEMYRLSKEPLTGSFQSHFHHTQ